MFLIYMLIFSLLFVYSTDKQNIVILHTNDTHSQIEPSDSNVLKYGNMGGYARRMGLIEKIRRENDMVLLFDAGDFSQGTPYYNFFKGKIETQGISKMKYDAITLGNHEFDNGVDSLAARLSETKLPVVSSNYIVKNTLLENLVKPFMIIQKSGIRIGIMALNVNPEGLMMDFHSKGLKFKDPLQTAVEMSTFLKIKQKCDLVICLSHLGSDSTEIIINDFQIAHQTQHIDLILGGHSHSMLENVKTYNLDGKPVMIAQMEKSGFYIGRIDMILSKKRKNRSNLHQF